MSYYKREYYKISRPPRGGFFLAKAGIHDIMFIIQGISSFLQGQEVGYMKKEEKRFFIVNKDILPDAILKTAEIKELLAKNEVSTINEAVEMVGLSRSAFYKYRDGVFPFYEASKGKIITIAISMSDKSGILSNVLNSIAIAKGNILTINQGIPLQGIARVSIAIETQPMDIDAEEILGRLRAIPGVKKVEILGQS